MEQSKQNRPRLTNATLYLGACVVFVLISLTLVIGDAFNRAEIGFGSCTMETEVARTSEAKAKGLSGRGTIKDKYAMLFPFDDEQPYFWMKDMLVPIDIVWVNDDKVVKIDANLPLDEGKTSYQAPEAIDWVVEVGANRATACGVSVGSEIKGLRH